jgi:alkylated DNA nucleotide flippase Atl1
MRALDKYRQVGALVSQHIANRLTGANSTQELSNWRVIKAHDEPMLKTANLMAYHRVGLTT